MGFQLAYYRLHGRSDVSVYSAASTKAFKKGRTEAVRCTSKESGKSPAACAIILGPIKR